MTARTQQDRTPTNNTPPANNALLPGQLFVEMGTPLRLWTGVPTSIVASGNKVIFDTSQYVSSFNTRLGAVTLTSADLTAAGGALLASPTFTGDPKAPTPALGDVDTSIATTAFVANTIAAGPPAGAIIAPTTPTAPTPIPGTLWWSSTDGQLYVRYDDGNSQQWVTAANMEGLANAATKQDVAALSANVGRNLIHNPLFNVAQRGAGPWSTNVYTVDRWVISTTLDTGVAFNQSALTDAQRTEIGDEAAAWCLHTTFTGSAAAGAYTQFTQRIEDVRRLSGKTVTLSFWAVGTCPKLGVSWDQVFGTGGSPSAAVIGAGQAVAITGAFARYAVTFTVPSIAGKTLGSNSDHCTQLSFWYSSGATNAARAGNIGVQAGVVNIWGVQLEIGNVATPLEKLDPRYDLSNCQRFYCTGQLLTTGWAGGASQGVYLASMLPVSMRAAGSLTITGTTGSGNVGTINGGTYNGLAVWLNASAAAAGAYVLNASFTISADL